MAQSATNLKTLFQNNYVRAHTRIIELASKARTTLEENTEKGRGRVDDLASQLSVKDLVEKIRSTDSAVRRDLRAQLGLVTAEQLSELQSAIEGLKAELEAVKTAAARDVAALEKATARDIAKLKKQLSGAAKSAKSAAAAARKATQSK